MSAAEIDALRVGSIVRTPGGERVVREVKHWPPYHPGYPPRSMVTFTILRRSWTGACYTVLTRSDLRSRRYQPTTNRLPLNDPLSRRIARAIKSSSRKLTPEDVRGVR